MRAANRVVLAPVVLLMVVVGPASALAVLAGAVDGSPDATREWAGATGTSCIPPGGVPGLSDEQAANAALIAASAMANSEGRPLAARIALMVAITESGLRNLGPGAGHMDSLGLFQQRASQGWGTAAEELDPTRATEMFVRRLLTLPDWPSGDPWAVAQRVQRSAFADGANYRANWQRSGVVLAGLMEDERAAGGCDALPAVPTGNAPPRP